MWGRRYKKEELANKLELLNRQKLKYDWDNDDLEYSEGIVGDAKPEDDVSANFPGIELESDNPGAHGISAVAERLLEQEAIVEAENAGLTGPTNVAEEHEDNTVVKEEVIDLTADNGFTNDDDVTPKIASPQECKAEDGSSEDAVATSVPEGWSAGSKWVTFTDDSG